MEESILKSVKKVLGIADDYTVFDQDILMHINSTFSILQQLGIGPETGFYISDDVPVWSDFIGVDANHFQMVKSYIPLKVRMLFDPPATSFAIAAIEKQIAEYEWRLNAFRVSIDVEAEAEAAAEEG